MLYQHFSKLLDFSYTSDIFVCDRQNSNGQMYARYAIEMTPKLIMLVTQTLLLNTSSKSRHGPAYKISVRTGGWLNILS